MPKWIFSKRHFVDTQTKQENILNLSCSTGNSWEGDILTLFLLVPWLCVFPSLPFKLNDMLCISSGRLLLAFRCGLTHRAELNYWRAQFPHTTPWKQLLFAAPWKCFPGFSSFLPSFCCPERRSWAFPVNAWRSWASPLRYTQDEWHNGGHPLSVYRMEEWKTNSSKVFNMNRTKHRWKESQICWVFFQSAQSVPSYAACRHLFGFVFSFKSWDKCFY